MQLLIILLLVMTGGGKGVLKEVKPIAEMLGGEEAADTINKAEELCAVADALKQMSAFAGAMGGNGAQGNGDKTGYANATGFGGAEYDKATGASGAGSSFADDLFSPLAPVANIIDNGIKNCLSRYISSAE